LFTKKIESVKKDMMDVKNSTSVGQKLINIQKASTNEELFKTMDSLFSSPENMTGSGLQELEIEGGLKFDDVTTVMKDLGKSMMSKMKSLYEKKVYLTLFVVLVVVFVFGLYLILNNNTQMVTIMSSVSKGNAYNFWIQNMEALVTHTNRITGISRALVQDTLKQVLLNSGIGLQFIKSYATIIAKYGKNLFKLVNAVNSVVFKGSSAMFRFVFSVSSQIHFATTVYQGFSLVTNVPSLFMGLKSISNFTDESMFSMDEFDGNEKIDNLKSINTFPEIENGWTNIGKENIFSDEKMKFTGQEYKIENKTFQVYTDDKSHLFFKPTEGSNVPRTMNEFMPPPPLPYHAKDQKEQKKEQKKETGKDSKKDHQMTGHGLEDTMQDGHDDEDYFNADTLAEIIQTGMGLLNQEIEGGSYNSDSSDSDEDDVKKMLQGGNTDSDDYDSDDSDDSDDDSDSSDFSDDE
jgi:hypothetical protein